MARKGETVHLRCEADGDQPMDVTWKAKGSRIESDYEMRYLANGMHNVLSHKQLTGFHFVVILQLERTVFSITAKHFGVVCNISPLTQLTYFKLA